MITIFYLILKDTLKLKINSGNLKKMDWHRLEEKIIYFISIQKEYANRQAVKKHNEQKRKLMEVSHKKLLRKYLKEDVIFLPLRFGFCTKCKHSLTDFSMCNY